LVDRLEIEEFYTAHRDEYSSIYDAWEEERPYNGWTTAAVADKGYRRYMVALLRSSVIDRPSVRLLSLGCGNAFVESELASEGFNIDGVDLHERSVALARSRGVNAKIGDIFTWSPPFREYGVIYADGLLGHLYDPRESTLDTALERVRSWLAADGVLIISNDLCSPTEHVIASPTGIQFYRFSREFIIDALRAVRLSCKSMEVYPCFPAAQRRDRLVVTAVQDPIIE
jgi:predicted TPR repeat methyltransferase